MAGALHVFKTKGRPLMLNLSKILLPVDFSDQSIAAGRYAGMLACRFQSQVTMLHVVPYQLAMGGFEAPVPPVSWPDFLDDARRRLDSFMTEEFRRIRVSRLVLEGDPAKGITETAHSEVVDLIVMPTHGYGRFRRFIVGSVTAKVLHDADCAVLTSAHIEKDRQPESVALRNIICAVDLESQSTTALAWAADFARQFAAQLHVIHALPPVEAGLARYFDQDLNAALARNTRERIESLLKGMGERANVILEHGDVAKVVRSAAESVDANLVVIGRHASPGVLGRLRAHAYAIIREAPCPVVSI
jgi:nucleotide-binding universal stress UspA family protein